MSAIAQRLAQKYAKDQAKAFEPIDPHYETYVDARGRTKSRKRKMPSGLSKRDEKILKSVRRRAHYLDKGFTLCGFKFGWTAIFGLIPFAGDIIAFLLSYFLVLRKCRQANLPLVLEQRMSFNLAVSVGSGMIPIVGDVILAVWKANSRNALLLEVFLIQRAAENLRGSTAGAGAENPTAVGTNANEAAFAREAIDSARIDGRSGERVGNPPPYVLSDEVERSQDRQKGKKAKKWYGWGGGHGESVESIISADGGAVASGSGVASNPAAPVVAARR